MANFSHPQCYARALCDCSAKLSREHYVSNSVLKLLGVEHIISHASWLSPEQCSRPLPVSALSSKVLCDRHNQALSNKQVSPLIYRPGIIRFESPLQTVEIELQWRTWVPTECILYSRK